MALWASEGPYTVLVPSGTCNTFNEALTSTNIISILFPTLIYIIYFLHLLLFPTLTF